MEKNQRNVTKRVIALNPFPQIIKNSKNADKKLRVAAYCRVSSTSDEQLISYQNQVMHFKNYIRSNADYELIGIYADEGISGTDLRKREAFSQLMQAARNKTIDLIITKSLSRFGRNTLDCLNNIRELKALGVDVYFEKKDFDTAESPILRGISAI